MSSNPRQPVTDWKPVYSTGILSLSLSLSQKAHLNSLSLSLKRTDWDQIAVNIKVDDQEHTDDCCPSHLSLSHSQVERVYECTKYFSNSSSESALFVPIYFTTNKDTYV